MASCLAGRSWFATEAESGSPWRPLAIAHRGASAHAPENTIAAFEAAIGLGAFAIETDLRLTRDGHLVCHHDVDLQRIAGIGLPIAEVDLRDLWRWVPDRAPTLADACDAIGGRAALLLDLKRSDAAFHEALIDFLRGRGKRHDIALGVRSLEQFDTLTLALPWMPTVGLLGAFDDLLAFVADGGTVARLWEPDAGPEQVQALRDFGGAVCVMTGAPRDGSVGKTTPARLDRLAALGVDAIMLDDPSLLRQALAA
jgi:glycerophosphoryl diester phosphodiesterase